MKKPIFFLVHRLPTLLFIAFFIPTLVLGQGLVPCDGANCDLDALVELGENIMKWLFTIAGLLGALMFAYAGVLYLTAAGNETQINKATGIFRVVLFGILIALSAYLVIQLIVNSLLKPGISPLESLFFLSTGIV
ncbi:MAG: hypothetical protein WD003_01850 [Candidatus Paceibacterota bacterium]